MSGQKVTYTRITTDEHRRLMNSARIVENMDNIIQSELDKQRANMEADFQSRINRVNQRNYQQERMIKDLNSSMQDMERDFQRKFQQQASKHANDINNLNNKIDLEVNHIHQRLDAQREEYKSLIQEQSRILSNRIDSIQNSIKAKEQNQKAQANEWLKNAKDALRLVDTYNHKKFAPNKYNELMQRVNLVETNIKNGNYEISNLQNIWMDSYKLRAKLEQLENEWNLYFELAKKSNIELLATCEATKIVDMVFETEEEDTKIETDINYWSDGKLEEFIKKAKNIENSLNNSDNLKLKDLKQLIQDSITIKEQVVLLIDEAKEKIILSQKRVEIAQTILESLEERGFEYIEDCYEGDDQREAFRLKLENSLEEEVVTIITPQDSVTNKIDIHFFDKSSSESERQARLKDMLSHLKEEGVECDQPQCAVGTENKNRGDERVRDFKEAKRMKKAL